MEAILLLLSPFIIGGLLLGLGLGVTYLFTGKTPSQQAYAREVKKREHQIRMGEINGRLNRDAMEQHLKNKRKRGY